MAGGMVASLLDQARSAMARIILIAMIATSEQRGSLAHEE